MERKHGLMLLLLCCSMGGAVAQEVGNPGFNSPKSPDAARGAQMTNNVDELFIQLVGSGGHAEVELGNVAAKKARSDDVRQFASRMVEDHGKANKKLARAASGVKLDPPDGIADPDHRAQQKHLQSLAGDEFDLEYIRTQIADHQRTATLLEWQIGSGQNKELKDFAAENLPIVLDHLEHARSILDGLVSRNAGNH
jgi:putative membrane protein